MLYWFSLMDGGHRSPFSSDSGLFAGFSESSGGCMAIISVFQSKGRYRDAAGWNGCWSSVLPGQQIYRRRNRVRRQLGDLDIGDLSWIVGSAGGAGRNLLAACGGFYYLHGGKADVRERQASLCTLRGGGISDERGLCRIYIEIE